MDKLQKLVNDYIENTDTQLELIDTMVKDIKRDQQEILENFNKLFK